MTQIVTVAAWIRATNGGHLKDDARELARLGDGGALSMQASRYHYCEPQLDSAGAYLSIEIGAMGVLEGPAAAAHLLQAFARDRAGGSLFAHVPLAVAERYVAARGGIVVG